MQKTRESNYDLLRILCALAVISIHVSAVWLEAAANANVFGEIYTEHLAVACLWNALTRFAVPCFVMLSGAFLLADARNAEYGYFYRKQFRRIGIPALIFIGLYLLLGLAKATAGILLQGRGIKELLLPFRQAVCGESHLWYLYMMAGIYALTPLILRFKRDVGERRFAIVAWVFLALASIGFETSKSLLMWDIGYQFRFVGYFMVGYVIRCAASDRQSNGRGLALIISGGGIECLAAYALYRQEAAGIMEGALQYPIVAALCPWIVASSVCIFAGFSLLRVRGDLSRLAGHTFMVYLVHEGIWQILTQVIKRIHGIYSDCRILIPLSVVSVFLLSLAVSCGIRGLKRRKAAGS